MMRILSLSTQSINTDDSSNKSFFIRNDEMIRSFVFVASLTKISLTVELGFGQKFKPDPRVDVRPGWTDQSSQPDPRVGVRRILPSLFELAIYRKVRKNSLSTQFSVERYIVLIHLISKSFSSSSRSHHQVVLIIKSFSSSSRSHHQVVLIIKSFSSSSRSHHQAVLIIKQCSSSSHTIKRP